MDYTEFFEKVKEFEGFRSKPYKCPSGVLSIGYGHTHGVVSGMCIHFYLGEKFLKYDLLLSAEQIFTLHPHIVFGSGLYFALVDFVFNVGFSKYKNSTLRKVVDSIEDYTKLSTSDINRLSVQFNLWIYSKGKKLRGLEKRRNWECELLYID